MRRTPALIIGGGPAGATLALRLARAGLPHLLLERTREAGDALCGGFLSWRTLEMLARLGIEGSDLNPATITRLRLLTRDRVAEAVLPGCARAVSRRRLDSLMLDAAARSGARIERGIAARLVEDDGVRLDDGTILHADALFLASGKHDVRGRARPASARGSDPTIGLRVRLAPNPALTRLVGDAIELHLFDRGYGGLVLQEDGTANLCIAVRRSRLRDAGDPDRLLEALGHDSPALGERLAHRVGGTPADAIANVPYGWRASGTQAGLFRLGDQAAVIPSLAGEGMAIAFASGMAAADAYAKGGASAAQGYQRAFARRVASPITFASAAWQLAERPGAARLATRLAGAAPFLTALVARLTRV